MTTAQAFGGNIAVSTENGVTKVTLKKAYFPEIAGPEPMPTSADGGDIRKVVYGILRGLGASLRLIQGQDATLNDVALQERFTNLFSADDVEFESQFTFRVEADVNDVKNEP